jgi:D-alanine-D-alanine ligase
VSGGREPIVAVLAGGVSAEREVSLASGRATAAAAAASFPAQLFRVDCAALPAELDPARHVVLSTLHGTFGEDGTMQRLLDRAGFSYAGCDAAASALTFNKERTKATVVAEGVPVAPGRTFRVPGAPTAAELIAALGEEVVLKPNAEGSSVGLRFAFGPVELAAALAELTPGVWLAEQRVRGVELTVGVLHGRALGVVEIAPHSGRYDYASKYTRGATDYHAPARIEAAAAARVRSLAETAFAACGCRDFARIDFLLGSEGPVFLEINSLPGMTETSLLPKSAACLGHDFVALVRAMAAPALARFAPPKSNPIRSDHHALHNA